MDFHWQGGYGIFSISPTHRPALEALTSVATLPPEVRAHRQRDEELLYRKVVRLRALHDVIGKRGIGEAVGSAEGILDEVFDGATGEECGLASSGWNVTMGPC